MLEKGAWTRISGSVLLPCQRRAVVSWARERRRRAKISAYLSASRVDWPSYLSKHNGRQPSYRRCGTMCKL